MSVERPLILVVDDSPTICKIVEVALEREGYHVQSFPDGGAVLRWLISPQGRPPALMFLDIEMPKMDGYQVALKIKALPICKQTVIIMMSRHDGVVHRLKARLLGATEYLIKPFTVQCLGSLVKQHVK